MPILYHVEVDTIPGIIKAKKAIKLNDCDAYFSEIKARVEKHHGKEPTSDVFLSYSAADAKFAADTARILQSFDLVVFDINALPQGERLEEAVWEAMAESQALVMVVSKAPPSASTLFEFGAAQGWNKPVYVVVTDPTSDYLPSFLHGLPVYPLSRIEDLGRAIKNGSTPLSESETSALIEEYERIGESVDQLLLQPALLSKLTRQFKKRAKRQVAPEELLRTLLRLRKRGALRTTSKKKRVKA